MDCCFVLFFVICLMIKSKNKTKQIYIISNDTGLYKRGDLVECEEASIERVDFFDGDKGLKIIKKVC